MAKSSSNIKKAGARVKINRIKAVLLELDVSQKDLAEKIGLSLNSVARFCNNHGQPTLSNLRKIALALEVNIQTLLEPTPEKKTN
ncbi:DNA-binding transcriptional regulator, XRE family [Filimonas lacunae]|uniref:DNA-binding transcriptional regulator, XRE family n=1 Tax=Filimonas lacunae TaxID=477680 RepID=A0A1N7RF57_9BACT|nr:helix-turn-helix transcriptional regulator [Filimonas lacunae]SIT33798.1 DNA-binding transcriptional regulator, XRE family [Filimonas lacunae]